MRTIYLINGEDEFLKKQEVKKIEKSLFSTSLQRDFNYIALDAKQVEVENIVSLAKTLPWQSSHRLLIINNIEQLKHSQQDALISYLRHFPQQTILVLTSRKIDKRKKLYQTILEIGKIINTHLIFSQALRWINEQVRKKGKKISFENISLLKQRVGGDSENLAQNIDKLISYVGEQEEITKEDIEDVISVVGTNDIFKLTAAVSRKDKKEALIILGELLQQRKKVSEIIGLIFWQIDRIQRGKEILKQGKRGKLISELKIPPPSINDFINSANKFSFSELKRDIELLSEADEQVKTTVTKPETILEILLLKICQSC